MSTRTAPPASADGAGRELGKPCTPCASRKSASRHGGRDHALARREDVAERGRAPTPDGQGVDLVIEAVGSDQAFGMCARIVRPRGRIANTGVHTKPVSLPLDALWNRDATVSTGQVDTYTLPDLLVPARTAADSTPAGRRADHPPDAATPTAGRLCPARGPPR
ncbi:zinc-binding dehydrogenase [Streptomyces sp. NPDC005012]|uniref:zinc-binding dehydrogenase n=1 Tax=Streptomyces sp. NPDC005012 TaxID=3154558 RepID=UPI0033B1FA53